MEAKYKSVTAIAPASVANVVCGFDTMGFSIGGTGDKVKLNVNPDKKYHSVKVTGKYGHLVPSDISLNTAGVSLNAFLKYINKTDLNVSIELEKNLPLGSGLGSSASSSVAAVVAANKLFGDPFTDLEVLQFAIEGEKVACGAAHADNVSASLFGGFNLVRADDVNDYIKIKCNDNLYACIVYPFIELKTSSSRKVLNESITISDAVKQSANAAGFIFGLINGYNQLLSNCMRDYIAEPQRKKLLPGFDSIKEKVMSAGAIGFGISGSGPSVFALCEGAELAEFCKSVIQNSFLEMNIKSNAWISNLNAEGAKIINTEKI